MVSQRLTHKENARLLDHLFPQGFAGQYVKQTLIPEGWESSSLKFIFHPTPKQKYRELVQLHKNIAKISKDKPPTDDLPSFKQFKNEYKSKPVKPEKELWDLVGLCVWDIFSDGHDTFTPDGRIAHLGSSRGSGSFLGDWIEERQKSDEQYHYMDFYMGTSMVSKRADLSPVYRIIFKRLREIGCDWKYHFPRLYLLDVSQTKSKREKSPENYNPEQAITDEQKRSKQNQRNEKLKNELEKDHQENIKKACKKDPPPIVQAYRDVFGTFPNGWPPV